MAFDCFKCEWVSNNQQFGGSIPSSSCPYVDVSLSKILNPDQCQIKVLNYRKKQSMNDECVFILGFDAL